MHLQGITLRTKQAGEDTLCEIAHDNVLEASGSLRDGKMFGVWSTFAPDGTVRTSVDVTPHEQECEADADALRETLAATLLQEWFNGFEDAPDWLKSSGALEVDWEDIEDDSRIESVDQMPYFLHGSFHPDPLVRDFCLMRVHLGISDEDSVFPATPIVTPFLFQMLVVPGAPVEALAAILADVTRCLLSLANEVDVDLNEPDATDEILRPTMAQLKAGRAQVQTALDSAKADEDGAALSALAKLLEASFG